MIAASNPIPAMLAHLRHHRFSLETYEAMVARGILTTGDRVELLRGAIVDVSPIGTRHTACVKQLIALFTSTLGTQVIVGAQDPVAIPPDSEPEPDISLLRPCEDFYATAHPLPSDVLLIVEVADTSLDVDRNLKLPLYAESGVPEVWLVDLANDALEVHTEPVNGRYAAMRTLRCGDAVTIAAFPENRLPVDRILPRRV